MFFKASKKAPTMTPEEWFDSAKRRYQAFSKSVFSDSQMPAYVQTLRAIIGDLEHAVELRPDFVEAWFNKACVNAIMAQHTQYRSCCETVLRLSPNHANALFCMAKWKWEDGEPEESIALLRRVVASNPNDAAAWYELSLCLEATGDTEGARQPRERAQALRQDLVGTEDGLASLEYEEPWMRLFS